MTKRTQPKTSSFCLETNWEQKQCLKIVAEDGGKHGEDENHEVFESWQFGKISVSLFASVNVSVTKKYQNPIVSVAKN